MTIGSLKQGFDRLCYFSRRQTETTKTNLYKFDYSHCNDQSIGASCHGSGELPQMWHLVELITASSLDVSAITQDLLSYFPTLVPLIISHHPVQGSFPGWLIYRKHIFCLVQVSRLQSLFRSRPKPTVSLCPAVLSIFLHLLFNSTYLCLWHARARLFTATILLCHWALSCFWWGHEPRGRLVHFKGRSVSLIGMWSANGYATQVYGKDGSTVRKLKSEDKNSNAVAYCVSSSEIGFNLWPEMDKRVH